MTRALSLALAVTLSLIGAWVAVGIITAHVAVSLGALP